MKVEDPPKVKLTCSRKKGSKIIQCMVEVSTTPKLKEVDKSIKVEKPGMEIAVVFDVSYSMIDSMESAKKGLLYLLKNVGPRDVIHLITFSNRGRIVFHNKTKANNIDELQQSIESLRVMSNTNMMAGVDIAERILLKSENDHKTKHMFIFTDGEINAGIKDKDVINKEIQTIRGKQIFVSTFGYGTQYDQDLMQDIASYGEGSFKYIKTSKELESVLGKVFDLQSSISYSAVEIYLRPFQSKDKVLKVNGYKFNELVENGIVLGSLYAGKDIKHFGFEMELNEINPTIELIQIDFEGMHASLKVRLSFTFLFNQDNIKEVTINDVLTVNAAKYMLTNYSDKFIEEISTPLCELNKNGNGKDKLIQKLNVYIQKFAELRKECQAIEEACQHFEIAIQNIMDSKYNAAYKELSTLERKHAQASFFVPPKKKRDKSRRKKYY